MKNQYRVLVLDDDRQQREMLSSYLENHGLSAAAAANGKEALDQLTGGDVDLVVSDVRMPEMDGFEFLRAMREKQMSQPVLFITAFPDVRQAVAAMRDGAVNYLEKPIDLNEMLESIRHTLKIEAVAEEDEEEMPELPEDVVLRSKVMMDLVKDIALIAPSDVGVLICGESGTGKEVMADLIHRWSSRASAPFLKLNCAAIPENLLESELFGHEKGAFTGANAKRTGLFEQANGGTILLDEISEMPMSLQAKLLRVTQDGSFIPVGGSQQQDIDVRIIAATNRDMEEEVEAKRFREDLYYRLNTFEVFIPPLSERREDVMPLAMHFAAQYAKGHKRFSDRVIRIFSTYTWPGNVRELQNTVKRAILMAAGGDTISHEHLTPRLLKATEGISELEPEEGVIDQMERAMILQALEKNNYNRSQTAKDLKMSRRTLTYKIRRLREAGYDTGKE